MASHGPRSDNTRVFSTTNYAPDDTGVMNDLSYSYCALRPHLYLSADDIALIEATRLANGYGHSRSDAAVHGTSDSTPDGTPDGTPNDTPDGSSVHTPTVIDYDHGYVDAMCTVGYNAECGCACCGGHDDDHILYDLRVSRDHAWPAQDEYPPELEIGDEGEGAAGLPPSASATAKKALAAERLRQPPDLFRIPHPAFVHKCATESLKCVELRIGWDGRIPRWRKGSELSYIVCTETFPPPLSLVVEDAMKKAISMWQGIGASFKQVSRDSLATFALRYDGGKCKKGYAYSFFPDTGPAELLVYEQSRPKAEYLPNILAHEIGHILGLRHEFAHEKESYHPSVLFGSEDDRSIMRYYPHLGQLQVSKRDLQTLREFYEYDQAEYGGLRIVDFEPELHDLNEANISSHSTRESSRRYSH